MKYSIAATALLSAIALADDFTVDCDGNEVPDYNDCYTIINNLKAKEPGSFAATPNECFFPPPPSGTDANSLNCIIAVCFGSDVTSESDAHYVDVNTDFTVIQDQCGSANAGGQFNDQTKSYLVSAKLNPNYNPPSSRKRDAAVQAKRSHARHLVARDGVCTDGSGSYKLLVTSQNVEKSGTETAVTGRLPNGSSYTIQQSDEKSIGVEVSVSVEAGFFDLFDASTSTSVSSSTSETTTTGVTVNVDCDDGQDGVIYLYPQYTEYKGLCTTNNNAEIDVWVPQQTQNNYEVRCLGQGSK